MNLRLTPTKLCGVVPAIPSKSVAHRLLICAALADRPTRLYCDRSSRDILATVRCLTALGANIRSTEDGFMVHPRSRIPAADLYCGESGSTLRFLLPVAAALGIGGTFHLEGRLGQRPLAPLDEELMSHGICITRPDERHLTISGKLLPGDYRLPGNVSSQFISGLLLALPLLDADSSLTITSHMESAPYIDLTLQALKTFHVPVSRHGDGFTLSPAPYHSPGELAVEGDWSNAAFWFGANALGSRITVTGLDDHSLQGDRAVLSLLRSLGHGREVDVSQTPDLFPILAVAATAADGKTQFVGGARLRLKESDRCLTVARMLTALGGDVTERPDGLIVDPTPLTGGTVDAAGDHRIAMAAAAAATICQGAVTIVGAETTSKSYPGFWVDYAALGGQIKEV